MIDRNRKVPATIRVTSRTVDELEAFRARLVREKVAVADYGGGTKATERAGKDALVLTALALAEEAFNLPLRAFRDRARARLAFSRAKLAREIEALNEAELEFVDAGSVSDADVEAAMARIDDATRDRIDERARELDEVDELDADAGAA